MNGKWGKSNYHYCGIVVVVIVFFVCVCFYLCSFFFIFIVFFLISVGVIILFRFLFFLLLFVFIFSFPPLSLTLSGYISSSSVSFFFSSNHETYLCYSIYHIRNKKHELFLGNYERLWHPECIFFFINSWSNNSIKHQYQLYEIMKKTDLSYKNKCLRKKKSSNAFDPQTTDNSVALSIYKQTIQRNKI